MKFNLRRYSDYASCSLEVGNTFFDFGMLDRQEATKLLDDFKMAVEELEWYLQTTAKEEEQ